MPTVEQHGEVEVAPVGTRRAGQQVGHLGLQHQRLPLGAGSEGETQGIDLRLGEGAEIGHDAMGGHPIVAPETLDDLSVAVDSAGRSSCRDAEVHRYLYLPQCLNCQPQTALQPHYLFAHSSFRIYTNPGETDFLKQNK